MEANSVEVQEVLDDSPGQEKDSVPACDENDEKHNVEKIQNLDKNSEINKGNSEPEVLIIQSDEDDDVIEEPKKKQNLDKNYEINKGNAVNEVLIIQSDEDDDIKKEPKEIEKPDQKSTELQEEEIINQIFEKSKVQLSDGTEAPMYSRGPRYYYGHWPFNCHLCSIGGFLNLKELQQHITNRKHSTFLQRMPIDSTKYKEGLKQTFTNILNNPIKIYPGEKITEITPELQDRLLPVQERIFEPRPPEFVYNVLIKWEPLHIYNMKAPIIGLSYCFKMNSSDSIDYYCSLCDVQFINNSIYNHLTGNEHRAKYAEKHFPRLLAKISSFSSDVKSRRRSKKRIKYEVLRKVYRSIEEKRGFRQIHIVQSTVDKSTCAKHCSEILHYGDDHVVTTDEELKEMIKTCRSGIQILEPDPSQIEVESEYTKVLFRGGIVPPMRRPLKKAKTTKKAETPRKEETAKKKEVPHFYPEKKWDSFREMFGSALDDIDRKYANYKKMPEKHPEYENERKRFWNRHVEEAEKVGLYPDDCRFNTQWMPYWKDRMQKYYRKSIAKTKSRIKKLLGIPFNAREPSPIRMEQSLRRKRSPSPGLPARRRRTGSPSLLYLARQDQSQPGAAKSVEPPGVISVLRLLTALEANLGGILGPKALEYLSKSLLYEKDTCQNANQLLNNQEYYVYFVTAKEKLKGQLITNIIKKKKKTAATRAIKEIDTLIELFDDFCERTGKTVKTQEQNERPQIAKLQKSFNNDNQFENNSLRPVYNRNTQQDFARREVNQFCQYERRAGGMDKYISLEDYGSRNMYYNANPNQYNVNATNSNQYEQNRSMSSHFNQGSSTSQYFRSDQGDLWKSEANMAFHNNANNNPQVSGSNFFGGSYGNSRNQINQGNQNLRSDREGNLSTSYDDRSESYNFNLDYHRSTSYNSNLGSLSGGNSTLNQQWWK